MYKSTLKYMRKVSAQRGAPLMDWSKFGAPDTPKPTPKVGKRDREFLAMNDMPEAERIKAMRGRGFRTRSSKRKRS